MVFNHRTALHLQHKGISSPRKISQRNRLPLFHRFQRAPRRNSSYQRQLMQTPLHHLVLHRLGQLHDFNRAALVISAPYKTFFLQRRNMFVHRRQRSQLHAFADLFKTWRISVPRLERHQVIQHFFLPLGQGHSSLRSNFPRTGNFRYCPRFRAPHLLAL